MPARALERYGRKLISKIYALIIILLLKQKNTKKKLEKGSKKQGQLTESNKLVDKSLIS